jgi:3-oxoacyl-[acyl-carrier protein] reductase
MTRAEAQQWAERGIRINAVGPRGLLPDEPSGGACLASEPDLAALALYLASRRGRQLSGHVFDAAGVARRGC